MDLLQTVGQCDNGYACVYQNNLSWSSPTTPLPAEAHPRIVFERLFGKEEARLTAGPHCGGGPAFSIRSAKTSAVFSRSSDRKIARRVGQYLETVREVERRIEKAEAADGGRPALPDLDRPVGVPAAYADHARLMFDMAISLSASIRLDID